MLPKHRHWPVWGSYSPHQGLAATAENSHVWVYLGMDFCYRAGKGVYLNLRGQRVEFIGKRIVSVMAHSCREGSEARRWLAD